MSRFGYRIPIGLIGLLSVLITSPATAQFFSMPPAPRVVPPLNSDPVPGGVMADGISWLSLRRITDSSGARRGDESPGQNYHYDIGTDFVIWQAPRWQVEGMVRMLFLSAPPAPPETNSWLIDSQAMAVEQNIRVKGALGPIGVGVAFHHNSKHEVDQERRRTPIHDTLRLELDSPALEGAYKSSPGPRRWWVQSHLRGEYALEPIFQENATEPYAGGAHLEIRAEPWIFSRPGAVFIDSSATLIVNSADGSRDTDLDWLVRGGVRLGERQQSTAIFVDVHRLNDDWMTRASQGPDRPTDPWTRVSVGVSFRR